MATYIDESSEIPALVVFRPTFNAAQAVTALNCQANYSLRSINQSDNTKLYVNETKSFTFDLLGSKATSTVNVAGIGSVTYAQIASAIKKIVDAERLIAP